MEDAPVGRLYVSDTMRGQWNEAIRQNFGIIQDAVDEVNAAHPRTRYPLARRLWWRMFGEPQQVTQTRFRENALRANSYLAALHARRARPSSS